MLYSNKTALNEMSNNFILSHLFFAGLFYQLNSWLFGSRFCWIHLFPDELMQILLYHLLDKKRMNKASLKFTISFIKLILKLLSEVDFIWGWNLKSTGPYTRGHMHSPQVAKSVKKWPSYLQIQSTHWTQETR